MAYNAVSEVGLASPEELETIKTLREKLEPELKALADAGKDFPHITGDIFFTRLLRGNNGNVDESVEWYKKFMELREKFKLDDIHMECEKNNTLWKAEAIPYAGEIMKYGTVSFDEDTLRTPGGHLVWYDAFGEWRVEALFAEVGEDKYVKYAQTICERRTSALDKISRKEGRIAKIVRIMDFENFAMSSWTRQFQRVDNTHIQPVLMGTSIETVHLVFMINFPSFFKKVWDIFSVMLPPRLVARFRVLDTSFMQDKDLLTEVGQPLIKQLMATKKNSAQEEDNAMEGTGRAIPAGKVFERILDVSPGQKVVWNFLMGKGDEVASANTGGYGGFFTRMASKLSGSEVVFSVDGIWTDIQPDKVKLVYAKVRSAGKSNGDAAEFWVDGKQIEYSASTGVNIVALDFETQAVLLSKCYDTVADPESACKALVSDVASLPRYCLVLVAVKGTGAEELDPEAWDALGSCGAVKKEGHWSKGYALIGTRGGKCIAEERAPEATVEGIVPGVETDTTLVEAKEVSLESGEQSGSLDVDRGGMVILKWSNAHSSVAQKALASFKVVVE